MRGCVVSTHRRWSGSSIRHALPKAQIARIHQCFSTSRVHAAYMGIFALGTFWDQSAPLCLDAWKMEVGDPIWWDWRPYQLSVCSATRGSQSSATTPLDTSCDRSLLGCALAFFSRLQPSRPLSLAFQLRAAQKAR